MEFLLKLLFAFCCFVLSSCSFNKSFYQADKLPKNLKTMYLTTWYNDTTSSAVVSKSNVTTISFGANLQPTFSDSLNVPQLQNCTIESVLFKNRKGKNLNGWMVKSRANSAADVTLLFLHGNGGNIISELPAAIRLAQQGLQVFIIDYSGYGFSEGKPTRKGVLADADAALDYVRLRADVKNTRIVIYGQSLGGHLAATVARENNAVISGLVMEGGFSSHKDIAAHMFKGIGFAARILVKEGYSAKRSIVQVHKPVLVIHSSEDEVVPIWMGEKIYARANSPKSFYEIKHKHISGPLYYADSIARRIKMMVR